MHELPHAHVSTSDVSSARRRPVVLSDIDTRRVVDIQYCWLELFESQVEEKTTKVNHLVGGRASRDDLCLSGGSCGAVLAPTRAVNRATCQHAAPRTFQWSSAGWPNRYLMPNVP